jgi:hypothetical protein
MWPTMDVVEQFALIATADVDPRVWLGTKDHKILPRSLILRESE